jgi:hypothetical protein
MRIFLTLLVFAIGFSGFSTVAHAFDSQSCTQIMSAENVLSSNMDCAGHANDDKKQEKSSKDGKHLCLDCGHCCVSHAAIIQHSLSFDTPIIKTAFSFIHINVDDNVISGLKRPPKALV